MDFIGLYNFKVQEVMTSGIDPSRGSNLYYQDLISVSSFLILSLFPLEGCLSPLPPPPLIPYLQYKKLELVALKVNESGTSLVAQWLRVRLPMQGTRVRALI